MRRLIVSTFASLDGIMQAPGGPEEDPTGGFTLGGWMFGYGAKAWTSRHRVSTARIASWCLGAEPIRYSKRTGLISRMTTRLRRRSMQRKRMWLRAPGPRPADDWQRQTGVRSETVLTASITPLVLSLVTIAEATQRFRRTAARSSSLGGTVGTVGRLAG
jgi:hypothetical protein